MYSPLTAESGRLLAKVGIKPEMRAALGDEVDDQDQPPTPLAMLPGPGDRYIVPDGPGKGMKGYFARGEDGEITGIHLGGRLATRTAASPG